MGMDIKVRIKPTYPIINELLENCKVIYIPPSDKDRIRFYEVKIKGIKSACYIMESDHTVGLKKYCEVWVDIASDENKLKLQKWLFKTIKSPIDSIEFVIE